MNLPACLRSKGACNITMTYAAMETIENYIVLAMNSNISQLGADTEQGLNSSAATRLATLSPSRDKAASDVQEIYRQQAPHTFRCTGLPERLGFTRVCLDGSGVNSLVGHIPTPNANPRTLALGGVAATNLYYCEVVMTIEFDSYWFSIFCMIMCIFNSSSFILYPKSAFFFFSSSFSNFNS